MLSIKEAMRLMTSSDDEIADEALPKFFAHVLTLLRQKLLPAIVLQSVKDEVPQLTLSDTIILSEEYLEQKELIEIMLHYMYPH